MTSACVRSGYCCKKAPCPFGLPDGESEGDQCCYLFGSGPGAYECLIHDFIVDEPGADVSPAFGAGCCSPLNSTRVELLTARRNHGK